MKKGLNIKFWSALLIFGLAGQIAWTVENMYLNVFIYKLFHASASDISLMVGLSAVIATLTTWIMGAFSDYIGKRKLLICSGYILWGISILGFKFISTEHMMVNAATLGIQLAIALDCLMTFFGSTANDSAFNAWLTDKGDKSNRGNIEGYNSILPIVSMIVVFGAFMSFNLDLAQSWQTIFTIIGCLILVIGVLGFVLIEETSVKSEISFKEIFIHSLKKEVILENKMLYATLFAFAVFATSIQVFMPYLILYFEVGLGLSNYVLIFAPATIIAAILTTFLAKIYDLQGIQLSSTVSVTILMLGYILMILFTNTPCVFIGTLFIMIGYMTTLAVFSAEVRNRTPENCAGQFQGIRMICQVLIPGVIGPMIGSFLLSNAEQILNNDGTYSFIPNRMIFIGAILVGFVLIYVLDRIFEMIRFEHYELLSDDASDFIESNELPWQEHPTPQMKRKDVLSWDDYFMGLAHLSAQRSKDPNTQVGAVIVNNQNRVVGIGYNGFPYGCDDDVFPWARDGKSNDTKYPYVVHAELNAILNSNQSCKGCTIYVSLFPCNECAKAIIQSGISKIVYESDKYAHTDGTIASKKMLVAAGIELVQLDHEIELTINRK